jgi:hypothetical protein
MSAQVVGLPNVGEHANLADLRKEFWQLLVSKEAGIKPVSFTYLADFGDARYLMNAMKAYYTEAGWRVEMATFAHIYRLTFSPAVVPTPDLIAQGETGPRTPISVVRAWLRESRDIGEEVRSVFKKYCEGRNGGSKTISCRFYTFDSFLPDPHATEKAVALKDFFIANGWHVQMRRKLTGTYAFTLTPQVKPSKSDIESATGEAFTPAHAEYLRQQRLTREACKFV